MLKEIRNVVIKYCLIAFLNIHFSYVKVLCALLFECKGDVDDVHTFKSMALHYRR